MTPTLNLFLSDYSFIIALMGYDFNTKHYTLNITQSRHHHPSSLGTISFGTILLHAQGGEGLVLRLQGLHQDAASVVGLQCIEARCVVLLQALAYVALEGEVVVLLRLLYGAVGGCIGEFAVADEELHHGQYGRDDDQGDLYDAQRGVLVGLLAVDDEQHYGNECPQEGLRVDD